MITSVATTRLSSCRAFVTTVPIASARKASLSSPGYYSSVAISSSSQSHSLFSTVSNDAIVVTTNSNTPPPSPEPAAVLNRVFQTDTRPIILFDGVCNLCNNAVNLAIDWDPNATLRFAALQSNVGKSLLQYHGRDADDISSIVFVTKEGAYAKSDAILGISESLLPLPPVLPRFLPSAITSKMTMRPLAKLASAVVPKYLRDLIYDGVADNRYSIMGKREECRYDADGEFDDRFVNDEILLHLNDKD